MELFFKEGHKLCYPLLKEEILFEINFEKGYISLVGKANRVFGKGFKSFSCNGGFSSLFRSFKEEAGDSFRRGLCNILSRGEVKEHSENCFGEDIIKIFLEFWEEDGESSEDFRAQPTNSEWMDRLLYGLQGPEDVGFLSLLF